MSGPTRDNPEIRQCQDKHGAYEMRVWQDERGWWFIMAGMRRPSGPWESDLRTPVAVAVEIPGMRIGDRRDGPGGGVMTTRGFLTGD